MDKWQRAHLLSFLWVFGLAFIADVAGMGIDLGMVADIIKFASVGAFGLLSLKWYWNHHVSGNRAMMQTYGTFELAPMLVGGLLGIAMSQDWAGGWNAIGLVIGLVCANYLYDEGLITFL